MPTQYLESELVSDLFALGDLPFDIESRIDGVEYCSLMRRIGNTEGDSAILVSAFNSAI